MTIVSLTIARPAVMTEGGGFVPSAVAVAAPYAPRGPIIAGTSDTAVTLISTGAASWVLNEPSLEFHEGARMRASVIGATNIWMEGLVLSYIPDTRLLTLGVDLSSGTGATFDEWTLNVAGQPGAAGPSGPQGAPGGPTGPTGPTGMQGPPGINGATGASGPTGPSGTPGTPGGATGPTGPSGVAGAAGATGPTGASGAVGAAGGEVMVNGQLVVTAAAGALTVAVKTLAGADPSAGSPVVFRIPNASGTYDALSVTNPLSLVVPNGATLGVYTPGAAFRQWLVAFNNGGTVVLGIGRMSQEQSASQIITPLADSAAGRQAFNISTSADAGGFLFSTGAISNKPMRVLGYIEWGVGGLAAIGTWTTTNIRCVQLMGLGVRLPGQLCAASQVTDTGQQSWTGGAPVSGISLSGFTCWDPCNPVKVTAQSITYPDAASSQVALARLFRDAAALALGGMAEWQSDVGHNSVQNGFLVGWDFPNLLSTASVIYSARFYATGGTALLRWNPTALPLLITAEEFMG